LDPIDLFIVDMKFCDEKNLDNQSRRASSDDLLVL